jgi:biopolymer transport protein ExbD
MAKVSKEFDVWILASNTVYRNVPFGVVTDWAQQGRIGAADKLRTAKSEDAWSRVGDDPIISDFLFRKTATDANSATGPAIVTDNDAPSLAWTRAREDEDDDVDMIPLIDISLVLLIFFMMTSTVSSLSPIDVPQMKNAYETKSVSDALTITIDKRANGDVIYSLRVGDRAADRDDADLDTLAVLLVRLDANIKAALDAGKTAPEVRIACHRELPSERVHDLVKELETRKKDGKIDRYAAEVNEKK